MDLPQHPDIFCDVTQAGLLKVIFDRSGTSVNYLSSRYADVFYALMDHVERCDAIKGVIFLSNKHGNFIAGGDISEMQQFSSFEDVLHFGGIAQDMFNRLTRLKKPSFAAIHGGCFGVGFELVLACRYRFALDSETTVFAFPELKLGFIPGGGGTQRLPQLIGLFPSLHLLLGGARMAAKKAHQIGLVDQLIGSPNFHDGAIQLATEQLTRVHKERKTPLSIRFLHASAMGRRVIFSLIRAAVHIQTRGEFPPALCLIEVMRYGFDHGRDAGLANELNHYARLVASPLAKQLITLFFLNQELKKTSFSQEQVHDAESRVKTLVQGLPSYVIRQVKHMKPLGNLLT